MAFCTNCGSKLPDTARFCTNCGGVMAGAPSVLGGTPPPLQPAVSEPLDYSIEGDNLQVIRIRLKPGQEVYAEAGKMVYKQPQVSWDSVSYTHLRAHETPEHLV